MPKSIAKPKVFVWQGQWVGGAERATFDIAKAFREYHEINPTLGVFERREDIDFDQMLVKRLFPHQFVGYNNLWASLYLNVKGVLNNFDIVFTHGPGAWKTRDNFYVCHEDGDLDSLSKNLPPLSRLAYMPLKKAYSDLIKKADLIVSTTSECDKYLKRHGIKNYLKSSNFVDTDLFKPIKKRTKRRDRKFRVLFVGRVDPRKNIGGLKAACLGMRDQVGLHIVGAVGQSMLNISYEGQVSENELVQWYNSCDLFVLPSFWEGFSIALLEAMACQTPVLASVYAVPTELRKFAITFDPYKKNELKEKLLWAIENRDEMLKLAEKARRFVIENCERKKVSRNEVRAIVKNFCEVKM